MSVSCLPMIAHSPSSISMSAYPNLPPCLVFTISNDLALFLLHISLSFTRCSPSRDTKCITSHSAQLCKNGWSVRIMIIKCDFLWKSNTLSFTPVVRGDYFFLSWTQKWAQSFISDWSAVSQSSKRPFCGFIRKDKRPLSSLSPSPLLLYLNETLRSNARRTSFIIRSRTLYLLLLRAREKKALVDAINSMYLSHL